ncbi:glycosyltransferase family 61 protein [Cohnella candidum]|uniref:Glycosyltransferase family 61 protein n=1 Tax=Cohnella candidum TaxID=2674991 RepID=A0A3G3JT89_9BACL|nr:glycosyltransferase family 61 protein [Cohnella candidum]AYQ71443.1 glycosyltransferase family 61 protein [Cohnella candidum]
MYSGKPAGLIASTKDWLEALHGKDRVGSYYREFHHDDVTKLADSKGIDGQVPEHFRAGTFRGHPSFAALLRNARVWEKNGAVITPDNKLLGDVSRDYDKGMLHGERHPAFHRWHRPPLRRIREPSALLTYIWSGNYFHWLFDVLPRVSLLRDSGWNIRKYIVPRDNRKIQAETLNMMGISKKMRIESGHSFHARFDKLIVPSFVKKERELPSEYPRWAAEFLRNEFLLKRAVPLSYEYERIFISRANAWQRKLLNERDVLDAIRDYGFRVVELEKLTFKEQVRIFASAKVILASHGAGLANLVFSRPGAKVIEMFPPSYVPNYFWHLSNQMGLDHYYLIGERSVKPHPGGWEGSDDFEVDAGKLKELLRFAQI